MNLLNLGWVGLAVLTFAISLSPPAPETLSVQLLLLSLLAFRAGGIGMFIWVLGFAAVGVLSGQPEPQWTPIFFGALLGAYNIYGVRPYTPTVALSQLAFLLAPVPGLAIWTSWEAIPAGLAGVCAAGLSAGLISTLIHLYENAGIIETQQRSARSTGAVLEPPSF